MTPTNVKQLLTRQATRQQARRDAFAARAKKLGRAASVEQDPLGRFIFAASAAHYAAHEALGVHADWRGPTKLVHGPNGLSQLIEFLLPPQHLGNAPQLLDPAETQHEELLRKAMYRAARKIMAQPREAHFGNRLTPASLQAWIAAEGRTVAADEEGNLRLAIDYAGFDGQTRIVCGADRLQMRMTLGDWPELAPAVETAMLHLAAEANARTRLVRVAWLEESSRRRCEAQVDLTGVPWVDDDNPCGEATARHAVLTGLAGLELAARRLGRELAALADPANRGLVDVLNERAAAEPWWEVSDAKRVSGAGSVSGAQ